MIPVAPVLPSTPIEPILPLGPAPVPTAPASGEPVNPRNGFAPGQRGAASAPPVAGTLAAQWAGSMQAVDNTSAISPRLPPY